jgi:hypothetical protein
VSRFIAYLYSSVATAASLNMEQLAQYVKSWLPELTIELRDGLSEFYLSKQSADDNRSQAISQLAWGFARARMRNPTQPKQPFEPLPGEVDYETRRLANPASRAWGILYEGFELMHILRGLVPEAERSWYHIHIVFINQLFGTWEDSDRRYHARVSLYGFPSILSTSGIVEAPAKPREYYLLKQQYLALGMDDATALLESHFQDRCIGHNDTRLTEVMKGYVMQALAYHFWGDPFCSDKSCRLYNAHWQEEVISAQLKEGPDFCPAHAQRFKNGLNRLSSTLEEVA